MGSVKLRRPVYSFLLTFLVIAAAKLSSSQLITDEVNATTFLNELDPTYLKEANAQMKARWAYITDITDATSQAQVNITLLFTYFLFSSHS